MPEKNGSPARLKTVFALRCTIRRECRRGLNRTTIDQSRIYSCSAKPYYFRGIYWESADHRRERSC
jgi:hypothetical protein